MESFLPQYFLTRRTVVLRVCVRASLTCIDTFKSQRGFQEPHECRSRFVFPTIRSSNRRAGNTPGAHRPPLPRSLLTNDFLPDRSEGPVKAPRPPSPFSKSCRAIDQRPQRSPVTRSAIPPDHRSDGTAGGPTARFHHTTNLHLTDGLSFHMKVFTRAHC